MVFFFVSFNTYTHTYCLHCSVRFDSCTCANRIQHVQIEIHTRLSTITHTHAWKSRVCPNQKYCLIADEHTAALGEIFPSVANVEGGSTGPEAASHPRRRRLTPPTSQQHCTTCKKGLPRVRRRSTRKDDCVCRTRCAGQTVRPSGQDHEQLTHESTIRERHGYRRLRVDEWGRW